MGQPKFLQTSPYFHAFLILKPNFGFLVMSLNKFGFLSLGLHLGIYFDFPMPSHKTAPPSQFAKSYSYIIGAFHRALGGRTFGHKLQEDGDNVACPIASEYNLGLRPFHSNPQFKKTSTKNKPKLPHKYKHVLTI
ncbi:hypothetical protein GmHk_04G010247 [Glycine max]|nr:hypothetical protein GmHk_04G010247 [Glycine max]